MNAHLLFIILQLSVCGVVYSQGKNLLNLYPRIYNTVHITENDKREFEEALRIANRVSNDAAQQALSASERALLEKFPQTHFEVESIYDVAEYACGWYESGGPYKFKASSYLIDSISKRQFKPAFAHDFDLSKPWVEGATGDGIGEWIEFRFEALSPPVTTVNLYNGYMKSPRLWQENSRVKTLKMSVNGKPFALLHCKDTIAQQEFTFKELQSRNKGIDLALRFEIMDIYPGTKYSDVAIAELDFYGTGVHCFAAGTLVSTPMGSIPIEKLRPNDRILSFDFDRQTIDTVTLLETIESLHHDIVTLDFGCTTVTSTLEHPYFSKIKGWCSLDPQRSNYHKIDCRQYLQKGDAILAHYRDTTTELSLLSIKHEHRHTKMYSITKLDRHTSFFANGLLVACEEIRPEAIAAGSGE